MYIIVIAWTYVTLMMAVAEATSSTGTVMGAIVTFALYGMLPMGILVYILSTPARKRAIKAREVAEQAAYDVQQAAQATTEPPHEVLQESGPRHTAPSVAPDASSQTPAAAEGDAVAPVRKEL